MFVRGIYLGLIVVSTGALSISLLFMLALPLIVLPLSLLNVPDNWVIWFLEYVVLWAFGVGLAGLFVLWATPKLVDALERGIVWLNREIKELSRSEAERYVRGVLMEESFSLPLNGQKATFQVISLTEGKSRLTLDTPLAEIRLNIGDGQVLTERLCLSALYDLRKTLQDIWLQARNLPYDSEVQRWLNSKTS